MLKFMIAAALVVVPPPVAPVQTLPVDTVARAKFATENPKTVDAVAAINRYVNEHMTPVSDVEHYGYEDLWVMAPADAKGDCEDYALTKIFVLQRAGVPVVSNMKLVGVLVHTRSGDYGHAILAVLLPNGSVAYLDNLNAEPMTRAELEAKGYQFFDWKA